jgi:hypothetical protein
LFFAALVERVGVKPFVVATTPLRGCFVCARVFVLLLEEAVFDGVFAAIASAQEWGGV